MRQDEFTEEMYQDCLKRKENSLIDGRPFWGELGEKYNTHPEALRFCFRKELESRGDYIQSTPKILVFDIETSPVKAFTWGIRKQYLSIDNIIDDWYVVSWSAKWLNEDGVMYDVLTPREARRKADKRVVEGLWDLFNEADVIMAHNALGFDVKKMNTRFVTHGIRPPSPSIIIDTLKAANEVFDFTSSKLQWLGKVLAHDEKIKTDYDLWIRCYAGDQDALTEMSTYNQQDVLLLEKVFLQMRPFLKGLPNYGLYSPEGTMICPACGSKRVVREGYQYTSTLRYPRFHCLDCGAWRRAKKADLPNGKSSLILR
jgi:hypothetical protein